MEIDYKGANCVVIKSKNGLVVTDPTDNIKANEVSKENAITLLTDDTIKVKDASFIVDMPGEYEHNDISIKGIPMQRMIDPDGKNSTVYRVTIDGIRIAIFGHVQTPISDDDLEDIGVIDVLIIPVGGGGYTIDARDAATIVRQISPKIVIPTHYANKDIKYEVPQEELDLFQKEVGGLQEKASSLKIKSGSMPEATTIYEITRS